MSTAAPGLRELESLPWRRPADADSLRRRGRLWTLWTGAIAVQAAGFGVGLLLVEPWTFPLAGVCFWFAWAVPALQAKRGARAVVPIGSERSRATSVEADGGAERIALGMLADLLTHEQRDLAAETGVVLHRGVLGAWLVGERGALVVRSGGRRVDCWCVRVAEAGDLPAGDRVAHLLLALREDELGFATVANFEFSGAPWRVRMQLPSRTRPALDTARRPGVRLRPVRT